jgi:hypothetical protein
VRKSLKPQAGKVSTWQVAKPVYQDGRKGRSIERCLPLPRRENL